MKKAAVIFSINLIVMMFLPCGIIAQVTDCSLNYEKALVLYNSGMPDSALSMVKPCVENKEALGRMSKETRARIFRLAALSSIMTGNPGEAEKYARKLLVNQPDYKNNKNSDDLQEFRLMLDKISPQPSLRVGISGGINFPFLKLGKRYSNYELQSGKYDLNNSPGFQFGITIEKALTRSISLEAGAGITRVNFGYNISGIDVLNYQKQEYTYDQKITWVEIPVLIKYYFTPKSFRPYIEGGVLGRLFLNSMEKSGTYGRYWFTNSSGSEKILTTFLSDIENFGILIGGGGSYDFNKFSLKLDLRYNYNFKSSGISSKFNDISGYSEIPSTEKFHYSDDLNLVNFSHLQISIGIQYNLKYKVF